MLKYLLSVLFLLNILSSPAVLAASLSPDVKKKSVTGKSITRSKIRTQSRIRRPGTTAGSKIRKGPVKSRHTIRRISPKKSIIKGVGQTPLPEGGAPARRPPAERPPGWVEPAPVPERVPGMHMANPIDPAKIGEANTPVTELQLPERTSTNLLDPNNPGVGDYRPPIADELLTPLPDGVDPERFSPGRGDPAAPPSLVGTGVRDYDAADDASDVFEDFKPGAGGSGEGVEALTGTINKRDNWGSPDGPRGDDGIGDSASANNPGGGAETDDTEDDPPVSAEEKNERAARGEDLGSVNEDFGNDPEPEDGDPDEFKSPKQLRGLTSRGNTGGGNSGGSGQGQFTIPGEKPGEDKWLRHKMGIQGTGGVDPEDGGPAEVQGAVIGEGLNRDKIKQAVSAAGSAATPPPDDDGQGNPTPPRPELSGSSGRAEAASGQTSTGATGISLSPVDGGQGPGGPVVPPGPQFLESSGK